MSPQQKRYVQSVSTHLTKWLRRKSRPLSAAWRMAAVVLMHLDLEPAREILQPLYAENPRGRKPYDPILMLRALILMALLQFESIPKWAQALKTHPRLAKLVGFENEIPVAGSFYAFINRLEDGPYLPPCDHRIKPSQQRKGKHQRNLKTEKEQRLVDRQRAVAEYDSVTQKLGAELLSLANQPRPADLQYRLEELLARCAVIPSAELGLLGDLEALTVCGDGSALVSSANGNGAPSCECRANGIYDCACDRYYSDKTADWGYDSYRDTYYFGHIYYQHLVSTQGHDLPIHIGIGPASETDFTLSLKSLSRLQKMLADAFPNATIERVIYDAGHDALGIYQYLGECQIKPLIALNPRRGESISPSGTAESVDEQGRPLCPAGLVMRRHSHCDKRHRTYYNCPVKRPTHQEGKHVWKANEGECPLGVLCQPETKMGPVVYVKTDSDPRLYPPIDRNSETFAKLMNLRSGTERSNSLKKESYRLGHRVARSAVHYLVRLYLVSIVEHAKVWAQSAMAEIGADPHRLSQWVCQKLHAD